MKSTTIVMAALSVATIAVGCQHMGSDRTARTGERVERQDRDVVDEETWQRQQQQEQRQVEARRMEQGETRERGIEAERGEARPGQMQAQQLLRPEECPTEVQGATVNVVDLGDGVALEFIADEPGQVTTIRDRVYAMAARHQRSVMDAEPTGGTDETRDQAEMQREGMQAMEQGEAGARERGAQGDISPLPASHVAIVDVDRGVRLIFVPVERGHLGSLREDLQARAEHMEEGSCPANVMSMRMPNGDIVG